MKQIDYTVGIFLVALGLLLTGCGTGIETSTTYEEEFTPYVEEFNAQAKLRGLDVNVESLSIEFVNELDGGVHASCRKKAVGIRQIVVSRRYWVIASDVGKRALLLHEFGHCILNRAHDDTWVEERPKSIMMAKNYVIPFFLEHYEEYLDELFQN